MKSIREVPYKVTFSHLFEPYTDTYSVFPFIVDALDQKLAVSKARKLLREALNITNTQDYTVTIEDYHPPIKFCGEKPTAKEMLKLSRKGFINEDIMFKT